MPNYAAFPTGHPTTATVTFTADNCPGHRASHPAGHSLPGVLGIAMPNNGVRWASDYPLGYGFANLAPG